MTSTLLPPGVSMNHQYFCALDHELQYKLIECPEYSDEKTLCTYPYLFMDEAIEDCNNERERFLKVVEVITFSNGEVEETEVISNF